ncbi:MAG: Serine-tRNA ligase [Parcubacteria group bacterium GW2011_GWA2_44_12]|nr:MAG: Serine-tRNA ligase [Parcubacteria group bacterium GW2011_GWA2_44_12]
MLDIHFIRRNHDLVKRNNTIRKCAVDVDVLLALDMKNRSLIAEISALRAQVNEISKGGKPSEGDILKAKDMKKTIEGAEADRLETEKMLYAMLVQLPNITHESVPIGADESGNVVIRTWGEVPKFAFEPKDHAELGSALDLIDVERGSKVSGSRFWYIKNDLVFLEFAIIQYVLDFFAKKQGFIPILPPVIVREPALFGTGFFPADKHEVYKLENYVEGVEDHNNMYLIGTAEVALASYHGGEVVPIGPGNPKKYIGFSTCFRREAGTYSKDMKGIFRGHQFDKLELFIFCIEEDSWEMHETLLAISEKFWQSLSIPYQVLNMCSGDIGAPNAKKYDIEGWFPGQKRYRELGSCSNDTDFQARRLNIKYQNKEGNKKFVHTLNHTACALGRAMIAIMENYQNEDGSISIPDVLVPYMSGKKRIDKSVVA